MSLEDEFWHALKKIAGDRHVTLSDLVGGIDAQRQHGNLSSALRLFVPELLSREGGRERATKCSANTRCHPRPYFLEQAYATSSSFAHPFQASQFFRNCAPSKVGTRSERIIAQVTANDQNQRRRSGPPRVS